MAYAQVELQPYQNGFGQMGIIVGVFRIEGFYEHVLQRQAHPRVVQIPRQKDQRGHEQSIRIVAYEHTHATALVDIDDGHRRFKQFILTDLK